MNITCVCILSPSYEEGRSVWDLLKQQEKEPELQIEKGLSFLKSMIKSDVSGHQIQVIVSFSSCSGGLGLMELASKVLNHFKPSLVIMTGACAGKKGMNISKGDLIIAEKAIDLDLKTITNNGDKHQIRVKGPPEAFVSSFKLIAGLYNKEEYTKRARFQSKSYKSQWLLRAFYEYQLNRLDPTYNSKWLADQQFNTLVSVPENECVVKQFNGQQIKTVQQLIDSNKLATSGDEIKVLVNIRQKLDIYGEYPFDTFDTFKSNVHFGHMGCTSAVERRSTDDDYGLKQSKIFQEVDGFDTDIIAIDRESFAFYYATSNCNVDALVIKGVENFADGDTNIKEDGDIFEYCCRLSASYAIEVIKSYRFKTLTHQTIHNLFDLPSTYLKRADENNQDYNTIIREAFDTHSLVSICGMGGVGKSVLTKMFAHSCVDKYSQYIFWIPCESKEVLGQSCSDILEDILSYNLSNFKGDIFKKFCSNLLQLSSVLVIFDNLEDPMLLNEIPFRSNIKYLVTSRSKLVFKDSFTIQLGLLKVQECVCLFKNLISNLTSDSDKDLEVLSKLLECLPLAVTQSAKYIDQKKISIATYIKQFQEKEYDYEDIYDNIINRNIAMVVKQFSKDLETRVRNLLHFISLLNPDKINSSILQIIFDGKDENIHEVIVKLDQYSLIIAEQYLPEKNNTYNISVHRAVQKASLVHLRTQRLDVIQFIHQQFYHYLSSIQSNDTTSNCNGEAYTKLNNIMLHLTNMEPIIKHYYPTNSSLKLGNQLLNNQITMFLDDMNKTIFRNLKIEIVNNLKSEISNNGMSSQSLSFMISSREYSVTSLCRKISPGHRLSKELSILDNLKKLIVINSDSYGQDNLPIRVIQDIITQQGKLKENSDELAILIHEIIKNEPLSREIDIRISIQLFCQLIGDSQATDRERVLLMMELSIRFLSKFGKEILLSTQWGDFILLPSSRIELLLLYLSITKSFTRDCLDQLKTYILAPQDDSIQYLLLSQVSIFYKGDYKEVSISVPELCLIIQDLSRALFQDSFQGENLNNLIHLAYLYFETIASGSKATLVDIIKVMIGKWNLDRDQIISIIEQLKLIYGSKTKIEYDLVSSFVSKLIEIRDKYELNVKQLLGIIVDSMPLIQSQSQIPNLGEIFSILDKLASLSFDREFKENHRLKTFLLSFNVLGKEIDNYIWSSMFTLTTNIKLYRLSDQDIAMILHYTKDLILNDTCAPELMSTFAILVNSKDFTDKEINDLVIFTKELTDRTKNNIGQSSIVKEIISLYKRKNQFQTNLFDIIDQTKVMLVPTMDCTSVSRLILDISELFKSEYNIPLDLIKNIISHSKFIVDKFSLKHSTFPIIVQSISNIVLKNDSKVSDLNMAIEISSALVTKNVLMSDISETIWFFSKLSKKKPTKDQVQKILEYSRSISAKHTFNIISTVLKKVTRLVLKNPNCHEIFIKAMKLMTFHMESKDVIDLISFIEEENPNDEIIEYTETLTKLSSDPNQVQQVIPQLTILYSTKTKSEFHRIIGHSKDLVHGNVRVLPIIMWVSNITLTLSDPEIDLIKNAHLHLRGFPLESLSKFYFENPVVFRQNLNCVLNLAAPSTLTIDDYFDLFDLFNSSNSEMRNYQVLQSKREIKADELQPVSLKTPESIGCHLSNEKDIVNFSFKIEHLKDFRVLLRDTCYNRYLLSFALLNGETNPNNHHRLDVLFKNLFTLVQCFKIQSNEILFMARQLYICSFVNIDLLIDKFKEFKKYFKRTNPCNLYLILGSLSQCQDDNQLVSICRVLSLLYSIQKECFCCCFHISNLVQRLQFLDYTIKDGFILTIIRHLEMINSDKINNNWVSSKLLSLFKKPSSDNSLNEPSEYTWIHKTIFKIFNPNTLFNSNI
ncbi:hypothetical protein CYY_008107 [Polysphondylium violaceum]|uniref:NB-ARC domain-containing protein n=1 Tax=Polysphondylium violaceum TaxID=133409 RepID=A0A8J4UQE7_9MYCE|nr:hypothetical protein CYY_008107 [Polysphondylium violaceum]